MYEGKNIQANTLFWYSVLIQSKLPPELIGKFQSLQTSASACVLDNIIYGNLWYIAAIIT